MGTKLEVKVPLRPRQTELNIESKGGAARHRLVEAVDALRNRTRVKHRKARKPWVSLPLEAMPDVCWSAPCTGDGFGGSLVTLTRGDLSASVVRAAVVVENARTR